MFQKRRFHRQFQSIYSNAECFTYCHIAYTLTSRIFYCWNWYLSLSLFMSLHGMIQVKKCPQPSLQLNCTISKVWIFHIYKGCIKVFLVDLTTNNMVTSTKIYTLTSTQDELGKSMLFIYSENASKFLLIHTRKTFNVSLYAW